MAKRARRNFWRSKKSKAPTEAVYTLRYEVWQDGFPQRKSKRVAEGDLSAWYFDLTEQPGVQGVRIKSASGPGGMARVAQLLGVSQGALNNPGYAIPPEYPRSDYTWGPDPRMANWTSYPTYSYEQFARANPDNPRRRRSHRVTRIYFWGPSYEQSDVFIADNRPGWEDAYDRMAAVAGEASGFIEVAGSRNNPRTWRGAQSKKTRAGKLTKRQRAQRRHFKAQRRASREPTYFRSGVEFPEGAYVGYVPKKAPWKETMADIYGAEEAREMSRARTVRYKREAAMGKGSHSGMLRAYSDLRHALAAVIEPEWVEEQFPPVSAARDWPNHYLREHVLDLWELAEQEGVVLPESVAAVSNPKKFAPNPFAGVPTPYQMPDNAGPYLPEMYPYGVGGRPATYKIAKKNRGPRGGYSESEREALPSSAFLKPRTRSWPVSDREHAEIAIQYMTRGFGRPAEYPMLIQRLALAWSPEDQANRSIWTYYRRNKEKIEAKAEAPMPSVAELRRYAVHRMSRPAVANPGLSGPAAVFVQRRGGKYVGDVQVGDKHFHVFRDYKRRGHFAVLGDGPLYALLAGGTVESVGPRLQAGDYEFWGVGPDGKSERVQGVSILSNPRSGLWVAPEYRGAGAPQAPGPWLLHLLRQPEAPRTHPEGRSARQVGVRLPHLSGWWGARLSDPAVSSGQADASAVPLRRARTDHR
jgi:hypothetical protein